MKITRRLALKLLGAAGFASAGRSRGARAAMPLEQVSSLLAASVGGARKLLYRADATILLLGMPIYTRVGAGGGHAALREATAHGRELLSLRFSAGSYPDRARGLNRLGLFEETIVRNGESPEQAAYFGFLTSSPEESLDAGKESIESEGKDSALYEAIKGSIAEGWEASRRADFELPADCDWSGIDRLESLVRDGLEAGSAVKDESQRRPGSPNTFLHSVLASAWRSEEKAEVEYCYNGKRYRLEAERKADEKTGEKMLEEGVSVDPTKLVRLQGKIFNVDEGGKTSFRLWIEQGESRSLPVRFDYKPRGFLRVTFVSDPTAGRDILSDAKATSSG